MYSYTVLKKKNFSLRKIEGDADKFSPILVWPPVSIGASNFNHACWPCKLKGDNFFVSGST